MKNKIQEYAKLLIEIGLNIKHGQFLLINSPIECAEFTRMCVTAAYDAGAKDVYVDWRDGYISRERWLRAADDVFETIPKWQIEKFNDYGNRCVARLSISADDPELLKGVSPDRLLKYEKASGKAFESYHTKLMNSEFTWCVASVPTIAWAKKVFPDCDDEFAVQKLWNAILNTVRISGDGTAVEKWHNHCNFLEEKSKKLNELNFKSVHYTNSIGTDLVVELPEGHIWMGGGEMSGNGIYFIANMPTEEIFTAPKRNGVNGKVVASKPLIISGNLIENFYFILKDGKIVEIHAEKGEDILRNSISVDEGAAFLGEIALVPYDSPISQSGILFYNTLFDENASCHFAFGNAYPSCLKDGNNMTTEELLAHGINNSNNHVDFMVGTSDLKITGVTHDDETVIVFDNGNFVI